MDQEVGRRCACGALSFAASCIQVATWCQSSRSSAGVPGRGCISSMILLSASKVGLSMPLTALLATGRPAPARPSAAGTPAHNVGASCASWTPKTQTVGSPRNRVNFSCNHLPTIGGSRLLKPVTLPPGRAILATKPEPTGSEAIAKTMGMVRVCCTSAAVVGVLCDRMRSGWNDGPASAALALPRAKAST